jgi:TRAP-type uncharacterized transport system substrate-binding protein
MLLEEHFDVKENQQVANYVDVIWRRLAKQTLTYQSNNYHSMSRKKNPSNINTLAKLQPLAKRSVKIARDETYAWSHVFRYEWLSVLSLIVGIVLLVFFWEPIPPKVVGIAVGREGTSEGQYGEKLVAFFAEHGVKLNVTYTEGGKQPVTVMNQEKSIQSALVLGGLYKKREIDDKVFSLGSTQYEPLWLFYRGDAISDDQPILHFAKTSGIAIGEPGSGSNTLVHAIINAGQPRTPTDYKLLEWPYLKAVDALISGEIKALATVDGIDSKVIQRLLTDPNIRLAHFPLAPAYAKRFPQLDLVSIPRGSFTNSPIFPSVDIQMVATSLTLVVEKDLHPALQLLFLMAIDSLADTRDQFFSKPDDFPSHKDTNISLSPIAKQYFTQGSPDTLNYVGFILTSLINRIWFFILSALAIFYPLVRLIPNFRTTLGSIKTDDAQEMLYAIQERFTQAQTQPEFDAVMQDFLTLQKEVGLWIPRISVAAYYQLVRPIEHVKKIATDRQEFLKRSATSTS